MYVPSTFFVIRKSVLTGKKKNEQSGTLRKRTCTVVKNDSKIVSVGVVCVHFIRKIRDNTVAAAATYDGFYFFVFY